MQLICDANGNTAVSDDSFHAKAKGRPTESGKAVAGGRSWHGGGGRGVVARIWFVATSSLSLSRTGASWRICAVGGRAFNHDYTQDAREPRKQSSGSCAQAWPHNKRGRPAGGVSIAGREASAWLSDNAVASNLSSHSIDCALPSLNRLTTFWFRIRSESSVA